MFGANEENYRAIKDDLISNEDLENLFLKTFDKTNLLLDGSPNNLIEKENNIKILEEEKKVKKPNIKGKTM